MYLNPDNQLFLEEIESHIGFVDKSGIIATFNQYLNTRERYVCVSRPRRFGKTIMTKMLVAYYSCGCNSYDLFKDLDIAKAPSFKEHLNQYNVISIDTQSLISKNSKGIKDLANYIQKSIINEFVEQFPNVVSAKCSLLEAMEEVVKHTNRRFIIIVDEYDCVFRDYDETEKQSKLDYVALLKAIFEGQSSDNLIALGYITGILPIVKQDSQSALNNFTEYTIVSPKGLSKYFGFTADEVQRLCQKFNVDFEKAKLYYDGYKLEGTELYNPFSIDKLLLSQGDFQDYQCSTSSFQMVKPYICMNFKGLKEDILKLANGETIIGIDTTSFANDFDGNSFNSKDAVITYLIHLGFLAYDTKTKKTYVPNEETRRYLLNAISQSDFKEYAYELEFSKDVLSAVINDQDCQKVALAIEKEHDKLTSILNYNREDSLSYVVYAAFSAASQYYYKPIRELPTCRGFADLVYLPKTEFIDSYPALVIELKWNKTAKSAIEQIKEKQYFKTVENYTGDILLVGINYDKDTKKHSCEIESFCNDK